uniref:Superfamily II DNA/RNA helicase n=1 Tax=Clandestinovirus TaxID=2831644 RepID=A0A8F8KLT9_9VIRU|nr:superfamily II DNA/RNA helicase [Clandestinovirus]
MATYPFPLEVSEQVFYKLDGPSSMAASKTSRMWYYLYFQQLRLHSTSPYFLSEDQWLAYKKVGQVEQCERNRIIVLNSDAMVGKKTVLLKFLLSAKGKTIIVCSQDSAYQWQDVAKRLFNGMHQFAVILGKDDETTIRQKAEKANIIIISCARADTFRVHVNILSSIVPDNSRIVFSDMEDIGGDKGGFLGIAIRQYSWKIWITGPLDIYRYPSIKNMAKVMKMDPTLIPIVTIDGNDSNLLSKINHRVELIHPSDHKDTFTVSSVPSPRKCRVMPWDKQPIKCLHDVRRLLKESWVTTLDENNYKVDRLLEIVIDKAINRKEKCLIICQSSVPIEHCQIVLSEDDRTRNQFVTYFQFDRIDKRLASLAKYNRGDATILLCYHSDLLKSEFINTKHIIVLQPPTNKAAFEHLLKRAVHNFSPSDETVQCWHLLQRDSVEPRIFEWTTMHQNYQKDVVSFLQETLSLK